MAESLSRNKALNSLDLGGNNLGPAGATALAAALKGHPALKLLELGYNPLGAAGTKALVDVVKFDLPVSCGGGKGFWGTARERERAGQA